MMKENKKFTFKKGVARYRSFQVMNTDIKQNGTVVGYIGGDDFRIRFMVTKKDVNEDGNPNCAWKWVKLVYRPFSEQDARQWVNEHRDLIREKLDLWEEPAVR